MGSLSRLMRRGAGAQLTREDHLELSDQLYSLMARALQAADLAEIVGADALPAADQRLLAFRTALEREFLSQGQQEARTVEATLDLGWQVASRLPASELTMVSRQTLAARYRGEETDAEHGHVG